MSVDASDVLTLTLGRTVGADVTATVTLPDTGSPVHCASTLPRTAGYESSGNSHLWIPLT